MEFNVNDTKFSLCIDESETSSIKSYSKLYNVVYSNENLYNLVKENYQENDFIILDNNVFNLDTSAFHNINKKYIYKLNAIEENKNIDTVIEIINILTELNFTKQNKLIVIGGGITQDISGFVSCIYKRGIEWILIPTTVLSMTDSAIGGKTCLNHKSKNLLGVFYSPSKIFISKFFIRSLHTDDIISGIGESLKLSLIGGQECFDYFKKYFENKDFIKIIKMSTSVKKVIIEHDELDKNERRVLNYGHTMGHAIESTTNYFIPHGISVLYGMYIINTLFYDNKYQEINNLILKLIPEKFKKIDFSYNTFLHHLLNDKKNSGDLICFILLDDIGKSIFVYKKLEEINEKMKSIFCDLFTIL